MKTTGAGDLDQRIRIEAKTRVEDEGGGSAEAWVLVASVWAKVWPVSGRERAEALAEVEEVMDDITAVRPHVERVVVFDVGVIEPRKDRPRPTEVASQLVGNPIIGVVETPPGCRVPPERLAR